MYDTRGRNGVGAKENVTTTGYYIIRSPPEICRYSSRSLVSRQFRGGVRLMVYRGEGSSYKCAETPRDDEISGLRRIVYTRCMLVIGIAAGTRKHYDVVDGVGRSFGSSFSHQKFHPVAT